MYVNIHVCIVNKYIYTTIYGISVAILALIYILVVKYSLVVDQYLILVSIVPIENQHCLL